MRQLYFPRAAACLWGAVVFMPVGLNYLGFFLLLLAMLLAGGLRERVAQLRASPLWWPLVALTLWQAVILLIRPHYPETGQNTVHGLRISLTVALGLMLRRDELIWALRGLAGITLFNLAYSVIFYFILLKFHVMPPMPDILQPMIMLVGNKSINNALIFTMAGAAAASVALALLSERRQLAACVALLVLGVVLWIINFSLPSRTSLLALLIVLPLLCVHQLRRHKHALLLSLASLSLLVGIGVWNAPPKVRNLVQLGAQELQAARQGAVSEGSWVVRYHMYTKTAQMVAEKPLLGWGVGAWNSEWRQRSPALLADYNMPHNDYLWMGAQTGVPGALMLLALILAGVWAAWRRTDLTGRLAFGAWLILLMATAVNSALRDAQIGLSLLWVAMLFMRTLQEPDPVWNAVLPQRWRPHPHQSPVI